VIASFAQRVEAVEERLRRAWACYERSNKGIVAALVHVIELWFLERALVRLEREADRV
jgi:hypothetical protein